MFNFGNVYFHKIPDLRKKLATTCAKMNFLNHFCNIIRKATILKKKSDFLEDFWKPPFL
jgi:hypothetical protein